MRRKLALLFMAITLCLFIGARGAAADSAWNYDAETGCHGSTVNVVVHWYRYWSYPASGAPHVRSAWTIGVWNIQGSLTNRVSGRGQMTVDGGGSKYDTGTFNSSSGYYSRQAASTTALSTIDHEGLAGVSNAAVSNHPAVEMWAGKVGDGFANCQVVKIGIF